MHFFKILLTYLIFLIFLILFFQITYELRSQGDCNRTESSFETIVVDMDGNSFVVENIKPYSIYSFSIGAETNKGIGQFAYTNVSTPTAGKF